MADAVKFVSQDVFDQAAVSNTPADGFSQPAYTRLERSGVLARFLREPDPLAAILYWLEHVAGSKVCSSNVVSAMLCRAIADIDRLINLQLNDILHHNLFQQLEASWRGLLYLTEQTERHDRGQKVKVKLLSLSWPELSKDISRAIDFDQSDFFKLIYDNEFDMPGGEPFGVLIGDYQISHKIRPGQLHHDLDTLKEVARTAAAAFAPFICAAHPSLFGVDHFSELGLVSDIGSQFKQPEYVKWRALRAMEDARFLGVVLPQVLMRSPYKDDGSRTESFVFREALARPERDYLWGNAAYAFAAVLVRAYSESGWFAQIRGMKAGQHNFGLVSNLPASRYETEKYQATNKPSVNLLVGHRFESELSDNGFIPLSVVPYSDYFAFYNNASVQQAKVYDDKLSSVNARLSAMLQYILCVARFAHYIKVIGRDKVGGYHSAEQCEQELQRWLHNYTTASTDASNDVRARHPLREARIQVREKRGEPGRYYSIIQLQPHFQLDQMITTVKLVAELSPKQAATARG
ncbi:type VI secretion system contractile sheath large subunit [Rheinheimera sp. YQF-2]|uniref:Type VI secretion system contractile sheath large subunit n=1 Tax=Rheinheimera lutimaris TaxID=2740584 RepID=A0A7Y5AQ32_9GAMM|nr:type VI secretion system contractile sheath large subunit [Rheinheimera lutimaris]NRQ42462.1 type VI secretion system contractile sheath large subunit [Rheinheimera lutimaris]